MTHTQQCRWIVLWKGGGPTDEACTEAHAESAGRFDGACFARYGHVVNGFAVEVRLPPCLDTAFPISPLITSEQ